MHSAEERDARSPRHPGHLRGDRRRLALVVDTVRAHSVSAAVWVVAGGLTMYGMALAVANEMADFPGGPKALALSISASAEAMRPLRWPAERLDTLGGYLTYHNVILITFILAIYGAVQGARAIRGGEEQHSLEEILATGISRAAVVRDRAVGFAVTMVVISLGLGLGTAAGMAGGGEPDLGGSLISMGISALVAVVGYALGLVASQLMGSARAAAGLSALVLTALYVITNMGEELGPVGAVRFVSPFYYADFSRALVPGYGLDLPATAALVAMAVVLLGLAAVAFARRDYAARLWSPAPRVTGAVRDARLDLDGKPSAGTQRPARLGGRLDCDRPAHGLPRAGRDEGLVLVRLHGRHDRRPRGQPGDRVLVLLGRARLTRHRGLRHRAGVRVGIGPRRGSGRAGPRRARLVVAPGG
jgi:hypothetical protein